MKGDVGSELLAQIASHTEADDPKTYTSDEVNSGFTQNDLPMTPTPAVVFVFWLFIMVIALGSCVELSE